MAFPPGKKANPFKARHASKKALAGKKKGKKSSPMADRMAEMRGKGSFGKPF